MPGERGDSGDRGVAGERGPKGDHGQPGDRGERGAIGFVGYFIALFAAVAVSVMISLSIQRDSLVRGCIRNGDSKIIDAQHFRSASNRNVELLKSLEKGSKDYKANMAALKEFREQEALKRASIPYPENFPVLFDGDRHHRGDDPDLRAVGCEDAFPRAIPFVD